MMRKYVLALLLFIVCPCVIKAAGCTNSDRVKYQELAKNISYTYDYVEDNDNVTFNVIFSNISEGLYLLEQNDYIKYDRTGSEMTLTGFEEGQSYRFGVYTSDTNSGCGGSILYVIYVNIPYYNPYYTDKLCEGIEDYKFCNKWLNMNITYDIFKENVLKYKESLKKLEEETKQEEVNGLFDVIWQIYLNYYYIILPIIIIIAIIGIKLYDKKHDLF